MNSDMTLEKAIKILSEEIKHPYSAKKICRPDALKLGIEAMKRVSDMRISPCTTADELLPGETND